MRQVVTLLLTLVLVGSSPAIVGRAEESSAKQNRELADAVESTSVTLDDGLRASRVQGTPISAKFEIVDGKMHLSVYTMKGKQFFEVSVDRLARVTRAEPITEGDDLTAAKAEAEAMAKASSSLQSVASKAVADNRGFEAVSITPSLKGGRPVAEVTLLKNNHFKTLSSPLD